MVFMPSILVIRAHSYPFGRDEITLNRAAKGVRRSIILRTDPPTDRPTDRPLIWLILLKFQMAISPRGVVRSTSCLVLPWGFRGRMALIRGRRIEWRYFRFRQIQDGGSAAILENSNGDILAAHHPIYSVFGSRMGFLGSADRMALIPV